jgi:hypothetical protein
VSNAETVTRSGQSLRNAPAAKLTTVALNVKRLSGKCIRVNTSNILVAGNSTTFLALLPDSRPCYSTSYDVRKPALGLCGFETVVRFTLSMKKMRLVCILTHHDHSLYAFKLYNEDVRMR